MVCLVGFSFMDERQFHLKNYQSREELPRTTALEHSLYVQQPLLHFSKTNTA